MSLLRSHWFWIFLLICLVEELTFFCPFLSIFLLVAAFSPKIALRYAKTFVEFYNEVNGTDLRIEGEITDDRSDSPGDSVVAVGGDEGTET